LIAEWALPLHARPSWSNEDIFQMMKKPLSFTDYDVITIRHGLEVRSRATLALAK
jgi:hypothetical protein